MDNKMGILRKRFLLILVLTLATVSLGCPGSSREELGLPPIEQQSKNSIAGDNSQSDPVLIKAKKIDRLNFLYPGSLVKIHSVTYDDSTDYPVEMNFFADSELKTLIQNTFKGQILYFEIIDLKNAYASEISIRIYKKKEVQENYISLNLVEDNEKAGYFSGSITAKELSSKLNVNSGQILSFNYSEALITKTLLYEPELAIAELIAYPSAASYKGNIQFNFVISQPARIRLKIFGSEGNEIISLEKQFEAGRRKISWDLKDVNNRKVSPGVYFYRLLADNEKGSGSFSGKLNKFTVLF
ncbi:hypothetical protein ACFL35_05330 [Candidatus Riflebacteria bacterium]